MSGRRTAPRILLTFALVTMVVSIAGFVISMVLNAFVLDEYDAYGEVPIPGSEVLHLPAGEVTVTFHTLLTGSTSGSGLPIPKLGISINPSEGLAKPTLVENVGSTTSINNDTRVRVWVATVAAEGDYRINTNGDVSPFINPRLAFGHASTHGTLPWVFAALFGFSLLDLVIASVWLGRVKRQSSPTVGLQGSPNFQTPSYEPTTFDASSGSPGNEAPNYETPTYGASIAGAGRAPSYIPTEDGVRIEQLKTLAALRDSGALTQEEFESEKRRVLDGG
jgi:hypothetical protein